ncbi:MAG: O-antigen ligase family protein [Aureispira sp.]|nr:O-antigen ligase family protein [Aureispira sp.]
MKLPLWAWILCLLGLPLIMVHSLIDAVTLPRMLMILLAEAFIFGLFIIQKEQPFHQHSNVFLSSFLGVSLIGYLLIAGISLSQTLSLSDGLVEWFKIFSWLGIILVSSYFLKNPKHNLALMKASVAATLVVSLIGLAEFLVILDKLEQDKILYTVNSTFEHKNLLATGLLLSLPFSFIVHQQSSEKLWKGLALVSVGLVLFLVLVTQSRAAWIGLGGSLFIGLILVLFSPSQRSKILKPKWIGITTILVALAIGSTWFFSSSSDVANSPIKRVQAIFTYEDTKNEHTETIKERFMLWQNSVTMIKDHPLLGVGLGQWKIHFPKYNIENLRSEQGQVFFQRPHNDYLWIFSEIGILGGLFYISIFLSILYAAFKVLRHHDIKKNPSY